MYSNAAAVQTYNPAAGADGSAHPMHSVPAANQQYYSLPAQQMSMPPGAPVTASYAAGQPSVTAGQPQYPAGAGGGAYAVPGAPAGYQAPAMHMQQPPPAQMYMPSAASQQPQPTATEYQPYNMHGNCTCYTAHSVL